MADLKSICEPKNNKKDYNGLFFLCMYNLGNDFPIIDAYTNLSIYLQAIS